MRRRWPLKFENMRVHLGGGGQHGDGRLFTGDTGAAFIIMGRSLSMRHVSSGILPTIFGILHGSTFLAAAPSLHLPGDFLGSIPLGLGLGLLAGTSRGGKITAINQALEGWMRCGNSPLIAIPSHRVYAGQVSFLGLASSHLFVSAGLGGEVRSALASNRLDQWRRRPGQGVAAVMLVNVISP